MTKIEEYQRLSLATLQPDVEIEGWTRIQNFESECESILTGFKAAVFEKTNEDGIKTIVISFECFQDVNDIPSVYQTLLGFHSLQENNAEVLYNKVKEYYKKIKVKI